MYGTRITARGSLDWLSKQSCLPLSSPMAFHRAHSAIFKSQSKLAACSFSSYYPPSCSRNFRRRSVLMKKLHPCLSLTIADRTTQKHRMEKQAMVPSPSHPMVKLQTLSMKPRSGKRTKSEAKCLRRGLKPRETGSRMFPNHRLHSISSSIPNHTCLPRCAASKYVLSPVTQWVWK